VYDLDLMTIVTSIQHGAIEKMYKKIWWMSDRPNALMQMRGGSSSSPLGSSSSISSQTMIENVATRVD